ncbi:MAG: CPBP family intramembrane metalloprotease [Chloroflexi bacterium]|nr:MAG: CPBP family intramembrane metalloprotease [Chloroflexota bacterium]
MALGVYLGSLGISVMASYLALGDSVGTLRSGTGLRWTSIAGSALLMLNWLLVRTVAGEHRPAFKAIGLAMPASKWHLAFGVVSGCLFAAHFFFTGLLADLFAPAWRALPAILWEISVVAGLRSLSEELFFRGLVFNQLYRLRRGGFWAASAVATACNILPYIVLGWHSDPTFFTLTLFYVAALSMVNAFLYRMSHSIVPGVLNSVLFYSLTSFNLPGG